MPPVKRTGNPVDPDPADRNPSRPLSPESVPPDGALLDAYSRAVIAVVDRTGPAIVSIAMHQSADRTAEWVLGQLLSYGRVRRGYLGISGRSRPIWLRAREASAHAFY